MSLLLALLLGCGGDAAAPVASSRRVDAVQATRPSGEVVQGFCDVFAEAGAGKPYVEPALAAATPAHPAGWRWVNVWATWCGPCVAEMPLVQRWHAQLAGEGVPVALELLSFDTDPAEVARFHAKHPEVPPGPRIRGQDDIAPWLEAMGLPASTPIPLHVFVDPSGGVRCVRASALTSGDLPIVRELLR
ncbi:MAG: TlpA family protein disulfide reductase [Alphaproteobacteria bacterium]|nr:TlpA family protein disulfide reductase [Alphaproteobacteria bacterium]